MTPRVWVQFKVSFHSSPSRSLNVSRCTQETHETRSQETQETHEKRSQETQETRSQVTHDTRNQETQYP